MEKRYRSNTNTTLPKPLDAAPAVYGCIPGCGAEDQIDLAALREVRHGA